MVVSMTNIDIHPFFLAFSDMTYHLRNTRVCVCYLCCLIVSKANLKIVSKMSLHQQVKNTREILVSYHA